MFRIKIFPIIYNNNNNVEEMCGKKQLMEMESFHYHSIAFNMLIAIFVYISICVDLWIKSTTRGKL